MTAKREQLFLLCLDNSGYAASLEVRKVYRQLADPTSEANGLVRVVDESGEDYAYPRERFVPVELPAAAARLFGSAA